MDSVVARFFIVELQLVGTGLMSGEPGRLLSVAKNVDLATSVLHINSNFSTKICLPAGSFTI